MKPFALLCALCLPLLALGADPAPAGKKDAKCFAECSKTFKPCPASCDKDKACINKCIATYRECSKGCGY